MANRENKKNIDKKYQEMMKETEKKTAEKIKLFNEKRQ